MGIRSDEKGVRRFRYYLFDLDGTINDSGPGIMKSVQYALDRMGYPKQPEELLRKFVGPSLMDSFSSLFQMSEEQAEEAVRLYRENYVQNKALYDLEVYDGMRETLRKLKENGSFLAIVTSKPHSITDLVVDHFELRQYFDYITGPELSDPSSDKSKLIRRAMEALGAVPEETVMTGDTRYDVEGAAACGIASCGVTYGYGTLEELEEAGADFLADKPEDILKLKNR